MSKDEEHHGECGGQEDAHDVSADEDHENPANPQGNAVVGLDGVVGEHVAEELAAIERRNGKQIEKQEGQVDLDGGDAQQNDGLDAGRYVREKSAVEGEVDDLAAAWRHVDDDEEDEGGEDGQCEIGRGAGEGDEVFVAADFGEVAADDGGWFGPSDQDSAEEGEADERSEDDDGGHDEGADDIDVIDGIEGDAALHARGLIAEP